MKYQFYVGQVTLSLAVITSIDAHLITKFGGFTRTEAVGGWRNEQGKVFHDKTTIFEVVGDFPPQDIFNTAEYLKAKFNQESVLVVATDVDYNLF